MPVIGAIVGLFSQATLDDINADIAALDTRVTTLEGRVGSWSFLTGSADPSAGAGVAATQPALYGRVSADVLTVYEKAGAADTAWLQLVTATFTGNVGITGTLAMTGNITATTTIAATSTVTGERLIATSAGSAAAPSFAVTDSGGGADNGLYSEAADTFSITAGGVRYFRGRAAGVDVLNALASFAQHLVGSATQSSALVANTDNLALTAVGKLTLTSSGGPFDLTGLTNGVSGRYLWIENGNALGGDNVILKHDVTSTAANRFFFAAGADFTLVPGDGAWHRYNGTVSRWFKAS